MQKHECMPVLLELSELTYMPVYLNSVYCYGFGDQRYHYHEFIEICYVASGGGYHQIRDRVFECKKGDIYILNRGVAHAFFMSPDFDYDELLVKNLVFLPEFIDSSERPDSQLIDMYNHLSMEILTDDTSVIKLNLSNSQFIDIERLYSDIEREYHNMQFGSLEIIFAEITVFLIKLARYIKQSSGAVVQYKYTPCSLSIVEKTCEFIQENFNNPDITITEAAKYVFTSKSHLSRIFKKYTGKHFSEYLREFRLKEACRLICSRSMTNEQICLACGYRDLPTFYKNFRRFTGMSPNEYLRQYIRNNHNKEVAIMSSHNEMTSTERVRNTILGLPTDRTPIYGWVSANLSGPISAAYGYVSAFEDKYRFDLAHIFGGPGPFNPHVIEKLRSSCAEMTPDLLLDADIFTDPDNADDYRGIRDAIAFHKERGRFCYVQTPGFFENFNGIYKIEDQLLYLAEYGDELGELYSRQVEWTKKFADRCLECGADMIHISDDWGAQNNLMFSPGTWRRLIKPNLKKVIDRVHSRGALCSLHSDGCVTAVTDELAELGIDCFHPWQESACMPYPLWLEKYSDRFAIMGGICVQTTLGFGDFERLESEIRRVFSLLGGKRWICCTTHFVQEHCSLAELEFAFDLIYNLAREYKIN
jgi:AraC-like DNA-binding protein